MRIVNENYHTQSLTFREREDDDDPRSEVKRERTVEFDEKGRAEVDDGFGEDLIEEFDAVREAEGPEDVSSKWEADHTEPLSDVDFASERAYEIADEAGLEAGDFEDETPSGDTGFTADDVRGIAGSE